MYVDTSVLVACYCPERLSQAAERLVWRSDAAAVSPLTEVELCSALSLKVRTGELDRDSAGRILALFRTHLRDSYYRIVPVGAREYSLACEWIGRFAVPLRTADALHLAAAFANGLTLLTADHDLARSARHFGVKYRLLS